MGPVPGLGGGASIAQFGGMRRWMSGQLPLLSWLAFLGYLVTPTALALRLDGYPLNTRIEFLVLLFGGLIGWASLAGWLRRSADGPARRRAVQRAPDWVAWPLALATAGFLILIPIKLTFPRSDGIALCIRSPELPDDGCVWSPEGPGGGPVRDVSRYEPLVHFESAAGRPWRLGYVNETSPFNLYGQPEGTPAGRRQRLRDLGANPFEARLQLSPRLAAYLHSRFSDARGEVRFLVRLRGLLTLALPPGEPTALALGPLSQFRSFEVRVPGDRLVELAWHYRNYDCPTQNCDRTMAFQTLRISASVLEVNVGIPGTLHTIGLGYGHIRWQTRDPWALGARWLEAVALILFGFATAAVPHARALTRLIGALPPGLTSGRPWPALGFACALAVLSTWALSKWLVTPARFGGMFEATAASWLSLPGTMLLVLATFRARWAHRLRRLLRRIESHDLLLVWLLPLLGYVLGTIWIRVAAVDDTLRLNAGDDAINYASLAKQLLRQSWLLTDPASLFTKPAFPYLRALLYWLLGEGERYVAAMVAVGFLAVYTLVGYVAFRTILDAMARVRRPAARWAMLLLHAGVVLWLTDAFLAYGAVWSGQLFSEGPAWLLLMISAVMLVGVAVGGRVDAGGVALAGIPFAAACLFRTPLVVLTPIAAGTVLLATRGSQSRGRAATYGLAVPLVGAGVVIVAHGLASLPPWSVIQFGITQNTSIGPGRTLGDVFGGNLWRLFPSSETWIIAGLFAGLLLVSGAREWRAGGAETRGSAVRVLGFGLLCALGGFLLQVPFLPAPYYPRTIAPTYFILVALMPVWADRLSRRPGALV